MPNEKIRNKGVVYIFIYEKINNNLSWYRTVLHGCVKRKCKSASDLLVLMESLLLDLVVADYCL